MQRRNGWPSGAPPLNRKAVAECHPDEKHFAKGLCERCYSKRKHSGRTPSQVRHSKQWYRDHHFKRTFGMSAAERDALVVAHGGVCDICKRPEVGETRKALNIDHDHATGRIRGVLCGHCNRAIGLLRDDPRLLAAAIEYLK